MLTGSGVKFAKQDCGSRISGQFQSPERSCGSGTSQRNFPKNRIAIAELCKDISLEGNCGIGSL